MQSRQRGPIWWKAFHTFPMPPGIVHCPVCKAGMQMGKRRPHRVRVLDKCHIVPLTNGGWPCRDPFTDALNIRLMCRPCKDKLSRFNSCVGALACALALERSRP